jgi:hypothetical protein
MVDVERVRVVPCRATVGVVPGPPKDSTLGADLTRTASRFRMSSRVSQPPPVESQWGNFSRE